MISEIIFAVFSFIKGVKSVILFGKNFMEKIWAFSF